MDNLRKSENEHLKDEFLNTPVSEYASIQVSDTENEILNIETQIRSSKDEKEIEELEFILNYLSKVLEINNNYRDKVAGVDQSINELAAIIKRPKNSFFNFQKNLLWRIRRKPYQIKSSWY